jgi:hypothetical protein
MKTCGATVNKNLEWNGAITSEEKDNADDDYENE